MNKKQKIILSIICLIIELVIGYLFISRLYALNNIYPMMPFYDDVFIIYLNIVYAQLVCLVCLFINILSLYTYLFFKKNLELKIKKNKYSLKLQIPYIVVSSIISITLYIIIAILNFRPYVLYTFFFISLFAGASISFFLINIIVRFAKQQKNFENKNI